MTSGGRLETGTLFLGTSARLRMEAIAEDRDEPVDSTPGPLPLAVRDHETAALNQSGLDEYAPMVAPDRAEFDTSLG